jgi:hypothetical protein
MTIDSEDLKRLEDSLVHDVDDEPVPEGWGIYATPRFLARTTLIAYILMVVLVLLAGRIYSAGEPIPVFLMPGSLFVALPFAIVALYLDIVTPAEPEIAKKRTTQGRILTTLVSYVVLQLLTTGAWIGIALSFKLH